MKSAAHPLAHGQRPGLGRERAWYTFLLANALALGGLFVVAITSLLWKGGAKATFLTWYPTPLSGVPGEQGMRVLLGLCFYGALAWAIFRGWPGRTSWSAGRQRSLQIGLALTVVAAALSLNDHLPRFLLMMPKEGSAGGGVGPLLWNTITAAVVSGVVTLPIGVGAAIYLRYYARPSATLSALRVALDTLASLPSIVYGLFGFLIFVVQLRAGYSILAGALVLGLLNLPLVVSVSEESLASVPRTLEEASLALGATTAQTIFRVSLPVAWNGILSALVLSTGRVFAESAPLIMTAGTTVSRVQAYAWDPSRGGATLAVHLWYVNNVGLSPDRAEVSAATAAVLVLLIALTNTLAERLRHR